MSGYGANRVTRRCDIRTVRNHNICRIRTFKLDEFDSLTTFKIQLK